MATVRNIKELSAYIRKTRSAIVRGHAETMLRVMQDAEAVAKKNATREFIGRNGRRLSGRLLNSIFSGFDAFIPGQSLPRGFIGTRGIPYGRIHEEGGTIVPKTAKWLWVKQYGGKADQFRRMTPREFVEKMNKKDRRFKIIGKQGGKGKVAVFDALRNGDYVKLFALAQSVDIPARPYLRPAVDEVIAKYGPIAKKVFRKEVRNLK
jgi:hypothetical protein